MRSDRALSEQAARWYHGWLSRRHPEVAWVVRVREREDVRAEDADREEKR